MQKMKEPVTRIGCVVFVVKDGKILLGKRKKVPGDGLWGLPGGHLDYMESITDGARRELKEETDLTASKLSFLCAINDPLPEVGTHYIHFGFLAEEFRGELKNMEPTKCTEWKWFPCEKLPRDIFWGHIKLLDAFKDKTVFID